MRTVHKRIVSALIFSKDGKLFQGRKAPKSGGVYVDAWHLPGGRVEEGEADLGAALAREIREEVGLDLSQHKVKLIDDAGRGESHETLPDGERVLRTMEFYVYQVDLTQDAADVPVHLGDDLVEYRWKELAAISKEELTPPSQELFARLGYL